LAAFEDDGLVVDHLSSPDFWALGIEQDGGVCSRTFGQSFPHSHHLPVMFCVVSVGKVEPGDAEPLINEDSRVVWMLSFGSKW